MSGETEKEVSGWTLDTAMAHFKSLREADHTALRLQAIEYERRLFDLNHAHEQARQKEADYVTRDKYEDWIKQSNTALETALLRINEKLEQQDKALREKIEPLEQYIAAQQGSSHGKLSQQQLFMVVIPGLIITLLSIGAVVVGIAYAIRK